MVLIFSIEESGSGISVLIKCSDPAPDLKGTFLCGLASGSTKINIMCLCFWWHFSLKTKINSFPTALCPPIPTMREDFVDRSVTCTVC